MTNTMTGIDIRKTLLKFKLNPNHYDEQAIFDAAPETEQQVMNAAADQWRP